MNGIKESMRRAQNKEEIPDMYYDIAVVYPSLIRQLVGISSLELQGASIGILSNRALKTLFKVSCDYKTEGDEIKTFNFLLKYWRPFEGYTPPLLRRDDKGKERELRDLRLLEGIVSVPKVYSIGEILRADGCEEGQIECLVREDLLIFPDSIILDYVGDTTLDRKLRGTNDRNSRKKAIKDVLETLIDFEIEATKKSMSWNIPNNGLGAVFQERPMEERILDYIRAVMGLDRVEKIPEDVKRRVIRVYTPITRSYSGGMQTPVVCHGDLNTTNILTGKEDRYYFIDPKLKWRDPIVDLSCLLSSPGILLGPAEWEELGREFKLKMIGKMGGKAKIEGRFASIAERLAQPTMGLEEETEKSILNSLYNQLIHNLIRNFAVISDLEKLFSGVYKKGNGARDKKEIQHNIKLALNRVTENPERFGVTQEVASLYEDLRSLLIEVGCLSKEEAEKKNLEGHFKKQPAVEPVKVRI